MTRRGLTLSLATLAACNLFVPIDDHELAPPVVGGVADASADGAGGGGGDDARADAGDGAVLALAPDVVLVDKQVTPKDIFTAGSQVYWVSLGDRSLRASPKVAPQAQLLRTTTNDVICLWRLDALRMTWCETTYLWYGGLDGKTAAGRALLNYTVLRAAVAPNQVYGVTSNGEIWEVGLDTGQAVLSKDDGAAAIAYGGSAIFWANTTKNRIMKFDRPGGPAVEFSRNQLGPVDIAVDDTFVYWLTDIAVMKQARDQPLGTPTPLATNQKSPTRLALDAGNVYWTNAGDSTVMTVPKVGGETKTVGTCVTNPFGIAVDDDGVFFTCPADGTVKFAKKG